MKESDKNHKSNFFFSIQTEKLIFAKMLTFLTGFKYQI